jgi:hypothetical protein
VRWRRTLIVGVVAIGALAIALAGSRQVERALLSKDARDTLVWLGRGAVGEPDGLRVSTVPSVPQIAVRTARLSTHQEWRVLGVEEDESHDAAWVVIQVSPDLSSVAGQVTTLRYRRVSLWHWALEPSASDLLLRGPDTDHQ